MARLPQPGQDEGIWGDILNNYLLTTHNSDGSLKDNIITESQLAPAVTTKLNEPATVEDSTVTEAKLAPALQTKINNKADSASLATVATTGSYTDLTDKPTITNPPSSTDELAEGTTNLYYTNARAAAAAPVQSVSGKTGAVTLTKSDVGLANVDNTSDINKPVSTATQTALNNKADSASLSTVATSGSYTDLTDKPLIGAYTIVLGPTDPVPGGTPAGTVIVRRTS